MTPKTTQDAVQGLNDDLTPIRESVRALCADFPGEYWRRLDREHDPDRAVSREQAERIAPRLHGFGVHSAPLIPKITELPTS